ncbi:MAG TPA: hypothetical protein PK883_00610 [Anaerolineaceae bacterium]|nr:hypothetical protein [Anaerolineaceae bacterium]
MGTKEQGVNMEREQLLAVLGETPETIDAVIERSLQISAQLKREMEAEEKSKTSPK